MNKLRSKSKNMAPTQGASVSASRLRELISRAVERNVSFDDAFSHFKTGDGSGVVTNEDFAQGLLSLNIGFTMPDARELASIIDADGGGTVSLDEFYRFCKIQSPRPTSSIPNSASKLRELISKAVERNVSFEEAFSHFKSGDGSGVVTNEDFARGLLSLSIGFTMADARELASLIDADGGGTVSLDEFYRFCGIESPRVVSSVVDLAALQVRLRKLIEKAEARGISIRTSFSHFDKGRRGIISRKEFSEGLASLNIGLTVHEENALANHLDKDGDGMVTYEEFMSFARPKTGNSVHRAAVFHKKFKEKVFAERAAGMSLEPYLTLSIRAARG